MSNLKLDHETAVICIQRLAEDDSLESIAAGLHLEPEQLGRMLQAHVDRQVQS